MIALTGLFVVVLGTWPAGCSEQQALGSATGEAPVHLWSLWTSAAGLFQHGPLMRVAPVGFPGTFDQHLMDPINLVVVAPVYALQGGGWHAATVAWNALFLVAFGLAAWGALRLARVLEPDAPAGARALLMVALGSSPFLLAFPSHGRTELLPAVLAPLCLALAWRATSPEGTRLQAVGAGLLLGAMALGGWYLATFLLVGFVPALVVLCLRCGWRDGAATGAERLLLIALPALALCMPALWTLLQHPPDVYTSGQTELPSLMRATADVVYGPESLVRLPSFVSSRNLEAPAYLGLVVLGLGLVGVCTRPQRAIPWLLWGTWLALLALGPFLVVGSEAAGRDLDHLRLPPFFLETWVPPLRHISSWSRIACLVSLPLGLAAFEGACFVLPRLGRLAAPLTLFLLGGMAVDHATWPGSWSVGERTFAVDPPEGLVKVVDALPAGAIVHVPLDLHLGPEAQAHGEPLLWQLVHGRPVSALPPDQDALLEAGSYTLRTLALVQEGRSGGRSPTSGAAPKPGTTRRACMRRDLGRLARAGVGGVVWDGREDPGHYVLEVLEEAMGDPTSVVDSTWGWGLDPAWDDGQEPCRTPPLPGQARPSRSP